MNKYLIILLAIVSCSSWTGFCAQSYQQSVGQQSSTVRFNSQGYVSNQRSSLTTPTPATSKHNHQNSYDQRILNRVAEMKTIEEEQLKKIDSIESRLTRLEETERHRWNGIKQQLDEISKKVHDSNFQRHEAHMAEIKHGIDVPSILQTRETRQAAQQQQSAIDENIDGDIYNCSRQITSIGNYLIDTRSIILNLGNKFDSLATNLTGLSREIQRRLHNIPTKQYLLNSINSHRNGNGNGDSALHHSIPLSYPISCAHSTYENFNIQKIQISAEHKPFYVLCENDLEDGGWTVIQQRLDGSVNFNRNWIEYKNGFGNLAGEFFIGLDKLHDITSAMIHELLIVLEDFDGEKKIAKYDAFAIGSESEDYALNILGNYEGTAGDSLGFSASFKFSTFDNDNDGWVEGNCALSHTGAWWYNACEMSNLNGQYLNGMISREQTYQGLYWNEFRGPQYSLKSSKMMIRPIDRI